MPTPSPPGPSGAAFTARLTLLVTNLIKIAGLVIAVHEAFTTKDTTVIAVGAFMMAGAQVSEGALLALLEKLLGGPTLPPSSGSGSPSQDGEKS